MAASMRALGEDVGAPVGVVLEGGYDVDALGRAFADTIDALGRPEAPGAPSVDEHPAVTEAIRRVAQTWPALLGV